MSLKWQKKKKTYCVQDSDRVGLM